MALGLGTGVAIGAAEGPDVEVPASSYETAADCPRTAAAMQELTGTYFDFFVPSCPQIAEIERLIGQATPDPAFVVACKETLAIEPDSACRGVVEGADAAGIESVRK